MRAHESTRDKGAFGVEVFRRDLPRDVYVQLVESRTVAWDIETNGLDPQEARIGTCQLHAHDVGTFIVTHVADAPPPLLSALLADRKVLKVFHHAPFDLSFMMLAWGVKARNVACTKIAVKLLRPTAPSEQFSLKYLMARYFGIRLDKSTRFTDWMADTLSPRQVDYAVNDVVKLLDLYRLLVSEMGQRELLDLYGRCVQFLPTHVELRLHGCADPFSY